MELDGRLREQKGYYPDKQDVIIIGQPAWGGSSWDNQTLFDSNGYPLQSLKFYKDSVSKRKRTNHSIEDR